MRTNLKFHLIAITLICSVITILYGVLGPTSKRTNHAQPTLGRTVKIYGATWGENCNPFIAQAMAERKASPTTKDANGKKVELPPITPVKADNVLKLVASACDGKPACQQLADSNTLGVDPLPGCFKRLVVNYRCYAFDRLNAKDIGQGETLAIDCNPASGDKSDAPAQQ
jgi:hypothetical protein